MSARVIDKSGTARRQIAAGLPLPNHWYARRVRWLLVALLGACSFEGAPGRPPGDGSLDPDAPNNPDDGPIDGADGAIDTPPALDIVRPGLIQDLDADVGVSANTWLNQVAGNGDDVTRSNGTFTIQQNQLAGHAVVVFASNLRLVGDDPAPFAPLVAGSGLTWLAVIECGTQDNSGGGVIDKNQFFGTIRNVADFSGFTGGVDRNNRPYAMMRPGNADQNAPSTTAAQGWTVVAAARRGIEFAARDRSHQQRRDRGNGQRQHEPAAHDRCADRRLQTTNGAEFFTGRIARILIHDRPLSDRELATTGRALGDRYDIATSF